MNNKHMKHETVQITFGILAILSLVNGFAVLYTQPFLSVVTNDRVFFGSFILGLAFVALFLTADNSRKGTINN